MSEIKRVFFAFEVSSPWPSILPPGRILNPADRHLTIAFLGDVAYPNLKKKLPNLPRPQIKVGLVGKFDRCLFLPEKRPNVVAWHVAWFDREDKLGLYHKEMVRWLKFHGFPVRTNPKRFLAHVTVARRPFQHKQWQKTFFPLPVAIKNMHLYESLGGLKYAPIWSHHLLAPFEKKKDGELVIQGESALQLLRHAFLAVAFECPGILQVYKKDVPISGAKSVPEALCELLHTVHGAPQVTSLTEPTFTQGRIWKWHARLKFPP